MMRWAGTMAVVLCAVMATGCGGDGSESATTIAAGTGSGGTEGGSSPPAPTGISVPLPPAADAVVTTESGPAAIVQFIVPADQQQSTIAFYDGWTTSEAEEYARIESASGAVSWQNDPGPDGQKRIIAVLSRLGDDDFVTVTITEGRLE